MALHLTFCHKEKLVTPNNVEVTLTQVPKISFVFVNRSGWKNDSVSSGTKYIVFQGVCIDSKYYEKTSNETKLDYTCYNRNFPKNNFPLGDSTVFREYKLSAGSKYAMQLELRWWEYSYQDPTYKALSRSLTYRTINWAGGITITNEKDTMIKFIWPDDTLSGKFVK